MKRRFYRDKRERRKRWAERFVPRVKESPPRIPDYSDDWKVRTKSSEPLVTSSGTQESGEPSGYLEIKAVRPSTIPPIPSEPRRRYEFEWYPGIDRNRIPGYEIPDPKYKKLWRRLLRFLRKAGLCSQNRFKALLRRL